MKLKAAGYRRVSTEEQAESGHSLEAQQHAIEAFVWQRGWELTTIYTDAGLSGQSDQRPALNKLLEAAALGQFEVVVVHAIDRFYRSLTGLISSMELLRGHNVSFVSISENLDFTTPWGKLTLAVLGTLAEIYIDKLSAETKKGKQERARKGLYNGSIPFGYCTGLCSACTDPNGPGYCPRVGQPDRGDGQALIAHPIEAVGVRRAFKLSAAGQETDRDITEQLNSQPVRFQGRNYQLRPKRRPGDVRRFGEPVFQKDTIREMLLRVFYTGVVPYFGVKTNGQKRKHQDAVALYPGQHPALVPASLFEEVQSARKLRRSARQPQGTTPRHHFYPLSGLLRCAGCGRPMHSVGNAQGQRYYRCASRIQRVGFCEQPTLIAGEIEEQVADFLRQFSLADDWATRLRQGLRAQAANPNDVTQLEQRLARAKELYLSGDLSAAQFEQERSMYRHRLADLTTIDATHIISAGYIIRDFDALWGRDDDCSLKTKLLRSLFSAATVRGNALNGWSPNSAVYPLIKHDCLISSNSCHYESDGT